MQEKSLQGIEVEEQAVCPECGSKVLIKREDETYCKKCGFVLN